MLSPDINTLVSAEHLIRQYGPHTVVSDVSFRIARGEIFGVVGESGSGKSTIARMLLRLIEPTEGRVIFDGTDVLAATPRQLRALRRRLGVVFQDPYAALNPRMRVRDILTEPFAIHGDADSPRGAELQRRLTDMLDEVGLPSTALPRYPHEFSGGQRQRINIARALLLRPEFLVLDEPVSALDVSVGAQVINLLRDLQGRHGLTCLFISHSMPLVRYLCDRVAVMRQGRIVETGDAVELCDHPREPYTQQLIAATPELSAFVN